MSQSDDPFDCFGHDDEDDESDENDANPGVSQPLQKREARDPICGALRFHSGTEQSLCIYVEREMETPSADSVPDAKRVLQLVDQFCYSRHWMMHVGDQKGKTLVEFLQDFCQQSTHGPRIIVELGTYCGYSAILMAQTLLDNPAANNDFHVVSVDVDPNHQKVAQKLVQLANLQDYVSFVLLPVTRTGYNDTLLTDHLKEHFQSAAACKTVPVDKLQIHFLFIDHDKDLYVSDLQQLEKRGWIRKGTHVAADNVVFIDMPYRSYIQQWKDRGLVSSRLVPCELEYVIPGDDQGSGTALKDGIELTVYLEDPSSVA